MQPVTEWRVWKEADDLGQQQHTWRFLRPHDHSIYIYVWQMQGVYSVFSVALEESFVSVGVMAVFPYDDALLIFVIPIIFDNNKKKTPMMPIPIETYTVDPEVSNRSR